MTLMKNERDEGPVGETGKDTECGALPESSIELTPEGGPEQEGLSGQERLFGKGSPDTEGSPFFRRLWFPLSD